MAVSKAIRSNPLAQHTRRRPHPQLKAELFETLRQLNRGYGIALAALQRLPGKDRLPGPAVFSAGCLRNLQNRTEALRSVANRDLLRFLAGREEQEASRFSRLCGEPTAASTRNHGS
jgi:hypothetical protein